MKKLILLLIFMLTLVSSVSAVYLENGTTYYDGNYTYNLTGGDLNLTGLAVNVSSSENFYIGSTEYCDYPGRLNFTTDRNCTRVSTEYYNNQSVLTSSIFREDDATFQINILKNPPAGNYSFDVVYYFYDQDGVLDYSETKQTTGLGLNNITISSISSLLTTYKLRDVFDVYTQVSMLDVDGTTYTFSREFIGQLEIVSLTENNAHPQYYDLEVEVLYDKFMPNDDLVVDFKMINKGDTDNLDSILNYYLIDPFGKKYHLTKEVITFPKGTTDFRRYIDIPQDAEVGYWLVVATLETTIQGLIEREGEFEVVPELSFIEKLKRFETYINWVFVWIFVLIFMIILLLFLNKKSKKEKNKYKEIEKEEWEKY